MRITVKVVPGAKRERVKIEPNGIKAYVTAAPEKGKANKALITLLAGHFNVKKGSIRILRGGSSREKLIEIDGRDR